MEYIILIYILAHNLPLLFGKCIELKLKFVNSFSAVTIVGCDPVQVMFSS